MTSMHGKKAENKFTIKFSLSDPSHRHVADILNRQERGNKAQYIVDTVIHYITCDRAGRSEFLSAQREAR